MTHNGSIVGCPDRDQLKLLLSGELQGDVFSSLEAHIETCQACQETLAVLSDGAETGPARPAASKAATCTLSRSPNDAFTVVRVPALTPCSAGASPLRATIT